MKQFFLRRKKQVIICFAIVFVLSFFFSLRKGPSHTPFDRALYVGYSSVLRGDLPIYIQSIGTITPANTVLVTSRVDGQLMRFYFQEGDRVKEGALLAQIDPRPFEIQLEQAKGAYARDAALLRGAELELARYTRLYKEGSVPLQQLQSQEALVGQYLGTLQMDKAQIADAERLLGYTQIKAPVSGRLGLKLLDEGNMVRSGDTSGLVSLVQDDPLYALFSVVERDLLVVQEAMGKGPLRVEAWGAGEERLLGQGELAYLDNQIDAATGTLKAKARFSQEREFLYPKQFVTIKLYTHVEENVLLVPSQAVQQGEKNLFVFVLIPDAEQDPEKSVEKFTPKEGENGDRGKRQFEEKAAQNKHNATGVSQELQNAEIAQMQDSGIKQRRGKVFLREVTVGASLSGQTIILSGLQENELVVSDGVDNLRDGSVVLF